MFSHHFLYKEGDKGSARVMTAEGLARKVYRVVIAASALSHRAWRGELKKKKGKRKEKKHTVRKETDSR